MAADVATPKTPLTESPGLAGEVVNKKEVSASPSRTPHIVIEPVTGLASAFDSATASASRTTSAVARIGVEQPAPTAVTRLMAALVGQSPLNPMPATPTVPPNPLGDLLAGAFRHIRSTFLNSTPTASPRQDPGQSEVGTVTGSVGAADVDGDPLVVELAGEPTRGSVIVNPDGHYTYTPSTALAATGGTDTFVVTVSETNDEAHIHGLQGLWNALVRAVDGTPTADASSIRQEVTVEIGKVNFAPVAGTPTASDPDDETGSVTGLLGFSDPNQDQLTYTVDTDPLLGDVTVDAGGTYIYTPRSDQRPATGGAAVYDTFVVVADDSQGLSAPVSVRVVVAPHTVEGDDTIDAAELQDLVDRGVVETRTNADGTIRIINGTFTDTVVTSKADAAQAMNQVAELLGAPTGFATADDITEFTVNRTLADESDFTMHYYRLQQRVDGVPVLGDEVVLVADGTGTVRTVVSGHGADLATVDTTPAAEIDEPTDAVSVTAAAVLASLGDAVMPEDNAAFLATLTFRPELVVNALDPERGPSLQWRVGVFTTPVVTDPDVEPDPLDPDNVSVHVFPVISGTYYVAANGADAGTVLLEDSGFESAGNAVFVGAPDLNGDLRGLVVQQRGGDYVLHDASRMIAIYRLTVHGNDIPDEPPPGDLEVSNGSYLSPDAVSALANMAVVYDYFGAVLGHTSLTDRGNTPIRVSLVPDLGDAMWNENFQQFFVDGEWPAAVDILGHEYTHAVIESILGRDALERGEAGALNEAYADILGSLVEGKSGSGQWLAGEDALYLRDLSDPSSTTWAQSDIAHSDDYSTRYLGSKDEGGVHINSTIFSHAAYLMMNDPATSRISDETWAQVYYDSIGLMTLGTAHPFADARDYVWVSATMHGFTDVELDAIEEAFNKVNIEDPRNPGPDAYDGSISQPNHIGYGSVINADGTRAILTSSVSEAGANRLPIAITFVDTETGKQIGETVVLKDTGMAAFDPAGTKIAVMAYVDDPATSGLYADKMQVSVYDAQTLNQVGTTVTLSGFYGGPDPQFNAGGDRLVLPSTDVDGTKLYVIDVGTGSQIGDGVAVTGYIWTTPGFNSDGSRYTVLTEADPGMDTWTTRITVLDTATGTQLGATTAVAGRANAYTNTDGSRVMVVGDTVAVIDTVTGSQVGTTLTLPGPVSSSGDAIPVIAADGRAVITTVSDVGTPAEVTHVTVIDTATGTQIGSTFSRAGEALQTAVVGGGSRAVLVHRSHAESTEQEQIWATVVDTATGTQVGEAVTLPGGSAVTIRENAAGTRITLSATSTPSSNLPTRTLTAIDTVTGQQVGQTLTLSGGRFAQGVSADGNRVVTAAYTLTGNQVVVFDANTGTQVGSTITVPDSVGYALTLDVQVSPGGDRAAISQTGITGTTYDTRLVIVDTTTGRLVGTPVSLAGTSGMQNNGQGFAAQFTPDGDRVVFSTTLANYDAATGRIVTTASAVVVDAATGHQIGDPVTVAGTPANRLSPVLQLTPDGERGYFTTYVPTRGLPEYVRVTVVDITTGEKKGDTVIVPGATLQSTSVDTQGSRALFTINTTAMTGYHSRVLVMDLGIGKPLNTSGVW